MQCRGNGARVGVDADKVPTALQRSIQGRARAREAVQNQIAFMGMTQANAFEQSEWFLGGVL